LNYFLSPSILACDLGAATECISKADAAGAEFIHIDVMDGHFVEQVTFGQPFIKSIRKATDKIFDVHLMVDNPDSYIDSLAKIGADIVTVHIEADPMIHRTVSRIREAGMHPAVAINPGTSVEAISAIIQDVDMVLVMSVDPGYGGQKLIPMTLEKIRILRSLSDSLNIEIDGGVNASNIDEIIEAGANVIVAGSAVFKGNIEENVKNLMSHFPDKAEHEGKLLSFLRRKNR